ncbi:MAG: endo-arabinase [Bacteroidota bacterium]
MKKILLSIFTTIICVNSYSQNANDSTAIIRLLEKESSTWRSGDVKAHADCWAIKPYSRILVSTGDGTALDIDPNMVLNPPAGMMGNGGVAVNSNYKMNISGSNAWVSHNEESTAADGKKTYSYEMRILEKINGEWKLVGQSIHIYKPK